MMETSDFWKKHNYELVLTEDQSPTLRWLGSENLETMHHRGGAYSETQQIYGNPLREVFKVGGRSVVSVGLGLGYNEILVASEALQFSLMPGSVRLLSYESDEFLKEHFLNWIQTQDSDLIYDQVFQFFSSSDKASVKDWLRKSLIQNCWKLEGALQNEFLLHETYECIFYDAFSSKTSPHLWQEDFLNRYFAKASAPRCQISTYACTGALKRALKANGFEVILREGFHSKRNSTLGIRGSFSCP